MDNSKKYSYRCVMIIDDSYVDRYVAEHNIRKIEFAEEILSYDSARTALEYLIPLANDPSLLPQLIFLDINMPEMDGFEFLDNFEHFPESVKEKCIIIMLTSSLNGEDRKRADNNKYIKQFLNKPLSIEDLRTIHSMIF